jgi:hypothetical protein
MVMLGWNLALKGAEVFLVPMTQQVYEMGTLAPELSLVNYLRVVQQIRAGQSNSMS